MQSSCQSDTPSGSGPLPVTLLTGFLGSGKTTLLKRLLARPELADTAVLVNEFGEVALDHKLLWGSSEAIVLLQGGCLCCALSSELGEQLDDLFVRRRRGEVPAFARVVIETTGLADPGPILQTLAQDPVVASLYRLDAVVTTVDAVLGEGSLDRHFEAVRQAAVADRLVITKVDAAPPESIKRLAERLAALNPGAEILRAAHGEVDAGALLGVGLAGARVGAREVEGWLRSARYRPAAPRAETLVPGATPAAVHDDRVASFVVRFEHPVSGEALWSALSSLIDTHGDRLLRVKGLVSVKGSDRPRLIHVVQHLLYPVVTLDAWPDADRRTELVFIVHDLDPEVVRRTLAVAA